VILLSISYINSEEDKLLHQKYSSVVSHVEKSINHLIKDKQNATLIFAISVARNESIKNVFINKNSSFLDLDNFSNILKHNSNFKNIWFQLIDTKGISIYRSWTTHKNDSLFFRDDVKEVLEKKEILSSISVGKYDMTFKSMIPIFHEEKFIGIFEIISHFNSISRILEKDGFDNLFLADKTYKEQIVYPFTNRFLDNYYIANLNAKKSFIELVKRNRVEKIVSSKKFLILDEKLINSFEIKDNGKIIGYAITSKDLQTIDFTNIKTFRKTAIIYLSFIIVLIGFVIGIVTYSLYSYKISRLNSKLKRNIKISRLQKKKNQTILNSQKNIIIITDGENLQNANSALIEFFDTYKSLNDFKKDHQCICDTFIDMQDKDYVVDKDYDGKNWAEYILENSHRNFKAAIEKNNQIYHFALNVNISTFDGETSPYIIVTLTDISYEIEQQKQLKALNENLEQLVDKKTIELKKLNESLEDKIDEEIKKSKEKDNILFQQNKMAAIGDMLSNIAHQWRQPLSCITTAASSIQLQQELETLTKDKITESCEYIIKNSQYLSQTIEDIKNYFTEDSHKQEFSIFEVIQNDINFIKENIIMGNIKIIVDIDENYRIYGFKNEFQHAILNIINNSLDAFSKENITDEKYIFISLKNDTLIIKDNANGIDEKIINKIFDPYFTTKHQGQGIGLSLYMTRQILVEHQNCIIDVKNTTYEYENKHYKGLEFLINFQA